MKKMIYVHGYDNDCLDFVTRSFGDEYDIIDYDVSNEHPHEVVTKLKTSDCDLILGTTLGAFYAMLIPKKKILLNPIPPNACYNYKDGEFTNDLVWELNELKREFFDEELSVSYKDVKIIISSELEYEYHTFYEILYKVFFTRSPLPNIYTSHFNYKNISEKEISFAHELSLM